MRKLFIIILLAFVGVTMQAQVRTGLDLCLRDNETGDWLIGLFDDYAIYGGHLWSYAKADGDRLILTDGNRQTDVRLKRKKQAVTEVTVDGRRHKVSLLDSPFMPDYPQKDTAAFRDYLLPEAKPTTVTVVLKSGKRNKRFTMCSFNEYTGADEYDTEHVTDSLGRFSVTLPLACPTKVLLHGGYYVSLALQPGESVVVFVDDVAGRTYVMGGDGARLANEWLAHHIVFDDVDYNERDRMTFTEYIEKGGEMMNRNLARIDSVIQSAPTLSERYRVMMREEARTQFAFHLLNLQYGRNLSEEGRKVLDLVENGGYLDPKIPYNMDPSIGYMLSDYIEFVRNFTGRRLSVSLFTVIEDMLRDGRLTLDDNDRRTLDRGEALYAEIDSVAKADGQEAAQAMYNDHKEELAAVQAIYQRPEISSEVDRILAERRVEQTIFLLDSLNVRADLRERIVAKTIHKTIDDNGTSASPGVLRMLNDEVRSEYLRGNVLAKHEEFVEYARKAEERAATASASVRDGSEVAGLTDGKEIFERIIAPHRGKIIYIDVWGTWCVPCKWEMTNVHDMKETLKDKDIVYIYLCNNSNDQSWRNNIERFGIATENAVNYNLPTEQEAALEKYLGVRSYPTYLLVDRNGVLQPDRAPRPSQAKQLREAIEMMEAGE